MENEIIQTKIHTLRGQRAMLDFDLAELYEVLTKVLNQAYQSKTGRLSQLRAFPSRRF